jgi:hypothetical protein
VKILNIVLKVILCLILISPILGVLGIFPPPTSDMYNTPEAFAFIMFTMESAWYIGITITIVFAIALVLIVIKRTALAALLLLPITVNIMSFHAFLDGGLFTIGAVLAWALALLNAHFLWQNRAQYKVLWEKSRV